MKAFWSLITVLVLATLGLYQARVSGVFESERGGATPMQLPAWEGLVVEDEPMELPDDVASQESGSDSGSVVDPEVLERLRARVRGEAAQEQEPEDEGPVGPAFSVGSDGTLTIGLEGGDMTLSGDGSDSSPYVLPWDLLRGVQRVYSPREGKRELPEWLDALDGKHVAVEGNTLVPLVQSVTTEILVMQNPWDGCCIGVPPTPYDAIEVKLNSGVTFSVSATGYGRVEGVFEVDPYEVSGWLMGLFLITDASYTSGAGEALPGL